MVGMYDGSVCVYDIGRKVKKPFLEAGYQQKHTGPVWELRWVDQNSERGEKLVSISSDGRITQWTMKKGFEQTDLFKLKKVPNPNVLAFGVNSPVLIAGTDEGQVRTYTVHGLSSQQFQKDPVQLLDGILLMGEDLSAAKEGPAES